MFVLALWPLVADAGSYVSATVKDDVATGVATGLVDAPFPAVVEVLRDCGSAVDWLPSTSWSAQERLDAKTSLCSGVTRLPWPVVDRRWTVFADETRTASSWTMIFTYVADSGNLKKMDGHWYVTDTPDGTHIDFQINVAMMGPMPPFLLGWATRRVLSGVVEGVERAANGEAP
jgi:hypothetical protein